MNVVGQVLIGTAGSLVAGLLTGWATGKAKAAGEDDAINGGAVPGHNHQQMQKAINYILSSDEWKQWRNDTNFGSLDGVKKAVYTLASGYWGFPGDDYKNYEYVDLAIRLLTDYHKAMQRSIDHIVTSQEWASWRSQWAAKNPSKDVYQLLVDIYSLAKNYHKNDPTDPGVDYFTDYDFQKFGDSWVNKYFTYIPADTGPFQAGDNNAAKHKKRQSVINIMMTYGDWWSWRHGQLFSAVLSQLPGYWQKEGPSKDQADWKKIKHLFSVTIYNSTTTAAMFPNADGTPQYPIFEGDDANTYDYHLSQQLMDDFWATIESVRKNSFNISDIVNALG